MGVISIQVYIAVINVKNPKTTPAALGIIRM